MFESTKRLAGSWRAVSVAMRIPLLIFAVSTAAALQLEPVVDRVAELLSVKARAMVQADSRLVRLREELAGVQMEMMDVMRADGCAMSQLRAREAGLKYALRAEEIRRDESAQCPATSLFFSAFQPVSRCANGAETPRS
jgi:hypothetical protein